MDQDKCRPDLLGLFVQRQRETYACILTLVPDVCEADDPFQEGITVIGRKFGPVEPANVTCRERQAGRSIDVTGRAISGWLAARADLFLLPLPSSSQPAGPSERGNRKDRAGTSAEDMADTLVRERVADFDYSKVIAYFRLGLRRTGRTLSDSIVALSQ